MRVRQRVRQDFWTTTERVALRVRQRAFCGLNNINGLPRFASLPHSCLTASEAVRQAQGGLPHCLTTL